MERKLRIGLIGMGRIGKLHGSNIQNYLENEAEIFSAEGSQSAKPTWSFLERYNDAFVEEERRFVKTVLTGEPVAVGGDDGLQAVRIAKAAQKSLALGRPVKMDEIAK